MLNLLILSVLLFIFGTATIVFSALLTDAMHYFRICRRTGYLYGKRNWRHFGLDHYCYAQFKKVFVWGMLTLYAFSIDALILYDIIKSIMHISENI